HRRAAHQTGEDPRCRKAGSRLGRRRQDRGLYRLARKDDPRGSEVHGRAPWRQGRGLGLAEDRLCGRRPRRGLEARQGPGPRRGGGGGRGMVRLGGAQPLVVCETRFSLGGKGAIKKLARKHRRDAKRHRVTPEITLREWTIPKKRLSSAARSRAARIIAC